MLVGGHSCDEIINTLQIQTAEPGDEVEGD